MINLLLLNDRQLIRAEYRHRLFIVGGLLVFGLAFILLIIIGSFGFIISQRRDGVLEQVTAAKLESATADLAAARKTVEETNSVLEILTQATADESTSFLFRKLIEARGSGVKLNHLEFVTDGGGRIELTGRSETRAALLAYLEALRTDPHFQEIKSPIKNIIQERDLTFELVVTLPSPK